MDETKHPMLPPSASLAHLDSFTRKVSHVSSLGITARMLATVVVHGASSTRPSVAIEWGSQMKVESVTHQLDYLSDYMSNASQR